MIFSICFVWLGFLWTETLAPTAISFDILSLEAFPASDVSYDLTRTFDI